MVTHFSTHTHLPNFPQKSIPIPNTQVLGRVWVWVLNPSQIATHHIHPPTSTILSCIHRWRGVRGITSSPTPNVFLNKKRMARRLFPSGQQARPAHAAMLLHRYDADAKKVSVLFHNLSASSITLISPATSKVRSNRPRPRSSPSASGYALFTIPLLVPSRSQFRIENCRSPLPRGRDRRRRPPLRQESLGGLRASGREGTRGDGGVEPGGESPAGFGGAVAGTECLVCFDPPYWSSSHRD